MKANPLKQSALLAVVVGLFCLILALAGALAPMAILPKLDLPAMLALTLIALTLDAYWSAPKLCWPALLSNAALGAGAGRRGSVRRDHAALPRGHGAHRHRAQSAPGPRGHRFDAVPGRAVLERPALNTGQAPEPDRHSRIKPPGKRFAPVRRFFLP